MLAAVAPLTSALPTPFGVVPGEEAVVEVRIRNVSTLVDRYSFEVLGAAAMWTRVAPPELRLLPGTEAPVQLQLSPPRQPTPPAGPLPFGLRVSSIEEPGEPAVREGTLEIAPFIEAKSQLRPRTARGWLSGRYRLGITNEGNIPVDVETAASDPDDLLTFEGPALARLEPGGEADSELRVRARKFMLSGRTQPRPFEVVVAPRAAAGVPSAPIPPENPALAGALLQRPLLSWWLLLLVPLVLVLFALLRDKPGAVFLLLVLAGIALVIRRLIKRAKTSQPPAAGQPPSTGQPPPTG
jgi:hypothetical protein